MKKILLFAASLLFIVAPYLLLPTLAQANGCTAIDKSLSTYEVSIPKLPTYCTASAVTQKVLNIAFLLIGSVSLLFLIIGGFRYMTAGGNEEQVTSGKKTAIYAVVGLAVVILSVTIVNLVANLILHG